MNDEFESRLRASLRRHAQDAPPADPLAERVLRDLHARPVPVRRRREWRAWTLPLAAAAAVAVVAGAIVGLTQLGHSSNPSAGPLAGPKTVASSGPPAPSAALSAPASSARPDSTGAVPVVPGDLHGVHILDATFAGLDDGWLLARADCLDQPGTCTAMLRTTDGGAHWASMKPPPANVLGVDGCAAPCVDHIRFANSDTGYAYGDGYTDSAAFFMTTDGGAHWTEFKGVNVVALETLDNNVIRVTTTDPGCGPPGCVYQAQTAAIGSTKWSKPRVLNSWGGMSPGPQLVRGGDHNAYVLVTGHTAGGGATAYSTLYRSSDDGQTWTSSSVNQGEPCPQAGGEVDSDLIAAGGGDRAVVLCTTRQAPQHSFLAVSTDGGAHFQQTLPVPWLGARFLVGDPATVLLAAGGSHAYRSTDGGVTWQRVRDITTGNVSWAGFESATTGRVVADGGRTIWTTHNGGRTWTPLTFG